MPFPHTLRILLGRSLCVALLVLGAGRPAAAEEVIVLGGEVEAAEARVAAVLGAEREVFVSTFIVGDEPFSLTALALLRDAARRGVDVRLLVDAQWNKMPPAVEAHLVAEGVAVRRFHPFRLCHPLWITKRLHDKLLIVDGANLVVGGRNVESPYFGFGHQLERRDYVDLDLLIRGAVAREARDYFLTVWDSRHTAPSPLRPERVRADALRAAEAGLDRHFGWLRERIRERTGAANRPMDTDLDALADLHLDGLGALRTDRVRFVHDPPRGKGSGPGVGTALLQVLERAEESVVIESPYLIPTRPFRAALAAALDRGVRVRILTNSLATTDNLWAQAGYAGVKQDLVRMGVELWESTGSESIHSKAAVVDGRTVIVGSFNLDPRSARLNTEVVVVLESEPLADAVGAFLDGHLASAHRIDARGWPEEADGPYPGIPRSKVCRLRLLRLLAPLIRSQL